MRTALFSASQFDQMADEVVARLREVVLNRAGNFLLSEHTLTHYRDERWETRYFPALVETHREQQILDLCHADHRRRLADYTPAAYPTAVLRELERVLQRARAALG